MKKNLMLALGVSLVAVGLAACGSHSAPEAQPLPDVFPAERACADIPKPSDPHGLIGDNWLKDNPCAVFNMNRPGAGVDGDQAAKIVYDARMKALAGKRDIAILARQGTEQADNPNGVTTDFKGAIAQRRASLKAEINASGLALQGKAPEGYSIEYVKNSDASNSHVDDRPHSASPGLTPGK
ncbi:putative lipoprotein [Mycobacteroides abscessus subsp. abscessus]|uniref:Lipoprotein n=1 Tax=Mycobacteroides abscessus subsp. bolletii TaxID=319705 RepID=A0A9Q7SHE4_9MYCO|nr:hypothetical protein [Mycobacteroides abscessus]SHU55481.1 putative lipoprotein [Mycobacteroides abscessus subsp. bolletii]SHU73648.1 putative lipoprotein [Mycobacteroides abscessus subsp. bolletii]SHX83483.1 putative lipoprotein [Mycobacteroides abscessus subsp. bolletii]SID82424.1 Uncharacterised protein [Mycobacteroides abscessus subsp. abscessus]SIF85494.1 putative lipoprotein [Mycobacteroides abscessus subsp. abscessus]